MSEFRIDPIPNSSADWTSRDGEGRKWNGKAIQTFVRDGIKKAEENSENKIGATYFDEEANTQFQFKTIEDKESWLTSKDGSLVLGTDTIRVGSQAVIEDLDEIRSGAALGATALQSIPSEYITETELSNKSYATQSYVDTKISDLVGSAPETLDTLSEISDALKDNKDIVTVLENSIASKANVSDLDNYSLSSHTHSQYLTEHQNISHLATKDEIPSLTGYATESWVKEQKYLTEHQDLSGKQDKIADLEIIRTGAALGATALQSIPTEYVTETELSSKGYLTEHQDISGKQDVITDLATIRANASKGATALQSIPSEYITETELTSMNFAKKADLTGYTTDAEFTALTEIVANKADSSALSDYSQVGHVHDQYLTEHQDLSGKQDVISDLSNIRANALKGSTALQSVPSEYITETELLNKSYATQSYVDTKVSDLVGSAPEALNTLEELSTALKNNKDIVTVLENSIASKANSSDLDNYAAVGHNHDDLYYTESEVNTLLSGKSNTDHTHSQYLTQHQDISGKQDKISDLNTIRQNALKGSTALQSVPDEYITEEELLAKGYITLADVPKSDVGVSEEWVEQQGFLKEIPEEYAKKSDIPSVSGLASEQWVKDQKYLTEHQDLSGKQDVISDLADIRANAAKGASALQSIPAEYITETELNAKGYLTTIPAEYVTETELTAKGYATTTQLNAKQDTISDLGTIRTNASNGATAYGWGNHASAGYAKSSDLNGKANSSDLTSHTSNKSNPHGVTLSQLGVNASSAELNYLSGTTSNVQSQFNDLSAKLEKKAEADLYAKKSYVDMQINSALRGDGVLPSYITKGSERIAENVLRTRNAYSFVMGAISDLHTTGNDSSAAGVEHACLALNEINKLTQLDLIANLGDVMKGYMDDINDEGFKFVKQHMDSVAKSVPMLQLEGNHDDLSELSTEDAKQKAFAYIGANNLNVVTDFNNRFRNYGYRDFDDLRFRVIYLNTTDATEFEVTENIRVSPEQLSWLVNTAVNFSNKTEPETWHFIVLSHVPLNALYESIEALQTILKAMVSKSSGSVTVEGTSISYNFRSLAQKLVCHIHGHIHNFRTEWFDDLLSITVPNACFERNNEYGMLHESEVIRNIFGDTDKNGNQRQFNKTPASGEDTAFNVFVIDSRVNNKIYAYNYGAGIHRTINLLTKEITESSYESVGGEILPDGVYINSIPLSTEVGGVNIYNNGLGYKNETYISSSTGLDSSVSTHFATGVIPYSVTHNDMPDLYVFGVDFAVGGEDNYTRIAFYNSGGMVRYVSNSDIPNYFEVVKLADKYYKLKAQFRGTDKSDGVGVSNAYHNHGAIEGIRFSLPGTGEDVIISVRNSIVESIFEGITWTEYTNLVPTSLDKDGNPYNEGLGYKEGYRLSSSGGESSNGGSIISGFIPYNGEVIRAYGSTNFNPAATGYYINFYDSNHNLKLCCSATRVDSDPGVYFDEIDRRSVFTIDPSLATATDLKSATTYPFIRVSLPTCGHNNFIVTLGEPLTINE